MAFGDVKNQLGRLREKTLEQFPPVAKLNDVMLQAAQDRRDRLDGEGAVKLFLVVFRFVRCRRGIGLQIVGNSDSHKSWRATEGEWAAVNRARRPPPTTHQPLCQRCLLAPINSSS